MTRLGIEPTTFLTVAQCSTFTLSAVATGGQGGGNNFFGSDFFLKLTILPLNFVFI